MALFTQIADYDSRQVNPCPLSLRKIIKKNAGAELN